MMGRCGSRYRYMYEGGSRGRSGFSKGRHWLKLSRGSGDMLPQNFLKI